MWLSELSDLNAITCKMFFVSFMHQNMPLTCLEHGSLYFFAIIIFLCASFSPNKIYLNSLSIWSQSGWKLSPFFFCFNHIILLRNWLPINILFVLFIKCLYSIQHYHKYSPKVTHLILIATLWGRYYYYLLISDEESRVQRG